MKNTIRFQGQTATHAIILILEYCIIHVLQKKKPWLQHQLIKKVAFTDSVYERGSSSN